MCKLCRRTYESHGLALLLFFVFYLQQIFFIKRSSKCRRFWFYLFSKRFTPFNIIVYGFATLRRAKSTYFCFDFLYTVILWTWYLSIGSRSFILKSGIAPILTPLEAKSKMIALLRRSARSTKI